MHIFANYSKKIASGAVVARGPKVELIRNGTRTQGLCVFSLIIAQESQQAQ